MMIQKEDLGLSLSLSFPAAADRNPSSLQVNFMPGSDSLSSSFNLLGRATNLFDSCPSSSDRRNTDVFRVETRTFLKGIDVNRTPATAKAGDAEEDAGVSSPNSTISSISGKRTEKDIVVNENDAERASSRGISDDEDGDNCRKKLRLSKDQAAVLEESFKEHNTLNFGHFIIYDAELRGRWKVHMLILAPLVCSSTSRGFPIFKNFKIPLHILMEFHAAHVCT